MRFLIELDPNEVSIIRAALGEAALALHPEEVFERTGYDSESYDVLFEKLDALYKLIEQHSPDGFFKKPESGFETIIRHIVDCIGVRQQQTIKRTNVEFTDQ